MGETDAWLTPEPYGEKPFRARVSAPTATLTPQQVFAGCSDAGFLPRTLLVGVIPSGRQIEPTFLPGELTAGGTPTVTPLGGAGQAGNVTLQLRATSSAGIWYVRRFSLAPYRSVLLDVSRWSDVFLDVLRSTAQGCDVTGVVSNRWPTQDVPETLLYGEEYPTPNVEYLTPPGASEMYPAFADAGFSWATGSAGAGGAVTVAAALVAGVPQAIRGTHFLPTVTPFSAVWRIEL